MKTLLEPENKSADNYDEAAEQVTNSDLTDQPAELSGKTVEKKKSTKKNQMEIKHHDNNTLLR